jgi:hypothetical protein
MTEKKDYGKSFKLRTATWERIRKLAFEQNKPMGVLVDELLNKALGVKK